ncbi:ribosome silencing factor [Treponema pectinovorum]|uniref:ribosome silencing factor n=1 Tax=Treponema pectinovorum TaxID=164 RepID=UPI0011CCB3E7|nr:ribosome silencing factor [Treponema pectinovorum]
MEKTTEQKALEIADILEDGKAEDVVVIEVTKLTSCADFFVIATIHSSAHWQGLEKQVKEYAKENDMQIHLTHNKTSSGDDWNVIDLGSTLVHLMSKDARNFYELEKLWHAGRFIKGE